MLLDPLLLSLLTYWVVGLNNKAEKFFVFCKCYLDLCLFVLQVAGYGYGYIAGALVDTVDKAIIIAPMLVIPFVTYSAFFTPEEDYPQAFGWIRFISVSPMQPFFYGYKILYINEFTDNELDCEKDYLACDPLTQFSEGSDVWDNFIYLLLLSIFLRALAFSFLYTSLRRFNN